MLNILPRRQSSNECLKSVAVWGVAQLKMRRLFLGVVVGQWIRGQVEVDELNSPFSLYCLLPGQLVFFLSFSKTYPPLPRPLHILHLLCLRLSLRLNAPLQWRSKASHQHTSISPFTSAVLHPTLTLIRTTCTLEDLATWTAEWHLTLTSLLVPQCIPSGSLYHRSVGKGGS